MYCVNCATELQTTWKHCPSCGQPNVAGPVDRTSQAAEDGLSTEPPVPYTKAQRELDPASYEALVAAGKPDLVRRNGKIELKYPLTDDAMVEYARSVLSPASFRIWKAAGYPDIDSFIAEIEEELAELDKPSKPNYNVRYVVSEQELKQWWDRNVLKVWKKRGKPRVVIIDEVRVMYEVQLNFFEHYGYEMSGDMVDAWYWVGCPNIKVWDVQGTMERYFQNAQQLLALHQNQVANQRAGLADALASGLAQIGGALANNAAQRGTTVRWGMTGAYCSRCGTPASGAVCRFCQ